jgi:hypothetical protein
MASLSFLFSFFRILVLQYAQKQQTEYVKQNAYKLFLTN